LSESRERDDAMKNVVIGIDVGTGSARSGVFDLNGALLASADGAIQMFRPAEDFAEQSSQNIWHTICRAVRDATSSAGVTAEQVKGIGFDATCSLVAVDSDGAPVSLSPGGNDCQDTIVWMDHRATGQAERINATGAKILDFVGGKISPEMQLPKLLWLKENLPEQFNRTARFFDLPDWLVYKATGSNRRSLCSVTCKWTYQGSKGMAGEGWDRDFLTGVGLPELVENECDSIGNRFVNPGDSIGDGLTKSAAAELGLRPGIPVAASLIDAYAGALGTLGVGATDEGMQGRMALVAGTSTCHIGLTREPCFALGIWGPYLSVLMPDLWASEAGQSATGALLDRILKGHAAYTSLQDARAKGSGSVYDQLGSILDDLAGSGENTHLLTADIHVQPDFHGNRAPLADATRRGAITGLTLSTDARDLALQYMATIQALAYGTKQIVDGLNRAGAPTHTLVASGGLAKNPLYLREHADATGCNVYMSDQDEPVLLGSAMLGAVAAGAFPTLENAMSTMSGPAKVIKPRGGNVASYHARKYDVFLRMQDDFSAYRKLMEA